MTPLELAQQKRKEMAEAGISLKRKNPVEKSNDNPKSLRLAITAKCYQCEGEDADPNVRGRIASCKITDCALHKVRPYRNKND